MELMFHLKRDKQTGKEVSREVVRTYGPSFKFCFTTQYPAFVYWNKNTNQLEVDYMYNFIPCDVELTKTTMQEARDMIWPNHKKEVK